jgi:HSP20 family molecular chaperone IbpA
MFSITGVYPAATFSQDGDTFTCNVDLPGVQKDDIKITYEKDWVIIHAVRKRNEENEKISRKFYAPGAKSIKATAKNGVLSITGEFAEGKSIDIKWGD